MKIDVSSNIFINALEKSCEMTRDLFDSLINVKSNPLIGSHLQDTVKDPSNSIVKILFSQENFLSHTSNLKERKKLAKLSFCSFHMIMNKY